MLVFFEPIGMAIFARPVDTWPSPTLMGRVLPGPIKNRIEFGFLKKKNPKRSGSGSGFYKNLTRTWTQPDPLKTEITKKNPNIYINL